MLVTGPDPALLGQMTLMHHPWQFPVSVPATHWDETVFVFEGDVLGKQMCTMVEWPQMAIQQAANGGTLQVPTLDNLDALFDVDPLQELVGPFTAGEVSTELIQTRNVMCVPPKYVPILL